MGSGLTLPGSSLSVVKSNTKPPTKTKQVQIVKQLPLGLPKSLRVPLLYRQFNKLDPGTGTMVTQVFRANSLFDPDYSGVGHQPMGFDQYAALYAHYCVHSCRIKCTFIPRSTDNLVMVVAGVSLNADYSVSSDWVNVAEQSNTRYTVFGGAPYSSAKIDYPSVTHSFDAKSFFGVMDPNGVREIGSAVTASPSDPSYFVVFMQAADKSANVGEVDTLFELEYEAEFTEAEDTASS